MTLTKQTFHLHLATRNKLLHYLATIPLEKLTLVPNGFNNSVLWNIAHCIATQQILCYKLSGLPAVVSDEFIDKYRKGTFPTDQNLSEKDVQQIKEMLISTQKQLQSDYERGFFKTFNPYATSYGFELTSIEDAIEFNNTHEGMHLGVVIALNYFLK